MRRQTTFKGWGIGFALFFALILMTSMSACGPGPTPTPSVTPPVTPSVSPSPPPSVPTPPAIETYGDDEFGINWVNSPYTNSPHPISSQDRTDRAQEAGATWDRWPVYWYWVNQPIRWGEGRENFRRVSLSPHHPRLRRRRARSIVRRSFGHCQLSPASGLHQRLSPDGSIGSHKTCGGLCSILMHVATAIIATALGDKR